jgi:mycothiol maleylpyruvate isomerase-like protein
MKVGHDDGRAAFLAGLDVFVRSAEGLDDLQLMAASRCTGWTVGDVVVHVHLGLQEMLLGLVSPTTAQADTDASDYWRAAPPTNDDAADQLAGMRFVRLHGASYRRPYGAVRHLLPTASAVRATAARLEPGAVRFQGHVLLTGDFLATWAVELAVHHLDMERELALPPAAPAALRLARRTVEALAGEDGPPLWTDHTITLLGTGRTAPDAQQRAEAPGLTGKLPLLG